MRPFTCAICHQLVYFDNSSCLGCGARLGYLPASATIVAVGPDGGVTTEAGELPGRRRACANQHLARCNWLLDEDDPEELCESCRLTRVRPADGDASELAAFAEAEAAKRRLLAQVHRLGIPVVGRDSDPGSGLAFEMRFPVHETVVTGHLDGVITLDLSESDEAHRVALRDELGEAYRTVLGHLRHEFGHWVWMRHVDPVWIEEFRRRFGDERLSYDEARERHYAEGPTDDWAMTHVSRYATMHPWEDWAETFAHYLHIEDGLDTAAGFGLMLGEPARSAGYRAWAADGEVAVGSLVGDWLGLSFALNGMSRSIGQGDLYPFVLSPVVVNKLDLVHRIVGEVSGSRPVPGPS